MRLALEATYMTRTPWLPEHTAVLERMAGKVPDAQIAKATGHCERTVRDNRNAAGLPPYHPQRTGWSRRDWLLAGSAGLMEAA